LHFVEIRCVHGNMGSSSKSPCVRGSQLSAGMLRPTGPLHPRTAPRIGTSRSHHGQIARRHVLTNASPMRRCHALGEHAGQLFDVLESTRRPPPRGPYSTCVSDSLPHTEPNLADMPTAAAASAPSVASLAIRLHVQQSDPGTRRLCLDVVDQLVTFDAHGVADNLGAVER
jgi:hypothetical protein